MSTHQPSPECKEIFAQLSAYLDLEIPPDACRQMEEHFKDCPPCIEFVESLPMTAVGKVDKKALRAKLWEGRDRQVG